MSVPIKGLFKAGPAPLDEITVSPATLVLDGEDKPACVAPSVSAAERIAKALNVLARVEDDALVERAIASPRHECTGKMCASCLWDRSTINGYRILLQEPEEADHTVGEPTPPPLRRSKNLRDPNPQGGEMVTG